MFRIYSISNYAFKHKFGADLTQNYKIQWHICAPACQPDCLLSAAHLRALNDTKKETTEKFQKVKSTQRSMMNATQQNTEKKIIKK